MDLIRVNDDHYTTKERVNGYFAIQHFPETDSIAALHDIKYGIWEYLSSSVTIEDICHVSKNTFYKISKHLFVTSHMLRNVIKISVNDKNETVVEMNYVLYKYIFPEVVATPSQYYNAIEKYKSSLPPTKPKRKSFKSLLRLF